MNRTHKLGMLLSLLAALALAGGLLALTPGVARAADPSYPVLGADYGEPGPGQLITDVRVITGNSYDIPCPAGYGKRYPDLNMGSGGDYVYTCLKFGTDAAQGIEELYVSSNFSVPCDVYGRHDQAVDGDLNSGVTNGFVVHHDLFYCIHRPNTYGGSGRIPHPGEGYNDYFATPFGKLLHDVQFLAFDAGHLPSCITTDCADNGVGAFSYLEAAATIDPYCQRYFGAGYHPLFRPWEYHPSSGDAGAAVPQDAEVWDLNAGSLGKPLIYACGSYIAPDTTPPTLTAAAVTADGRPYIAGTWASQPVTVRFNCTDNPGGTGVLQVTPPLTVAADAFGDTLTGDCWDLARNHAQASFGPIYVDQSKPVITASAVTADGRPYTAGIWTNEAVTVSFHCSDTVSGLVGDTVAGATLATDGADQAVTNSGGCVDAAGNVADPVSFGPIRIDKARPVITGSATTTFGTVLDYRAGTWTNRAIQVDFACADALSGVASSDLPGITLDVEGDNQFATSTGGCVDNAGNAADPGRFGPVRIDMTRPVITASATTADGLPYAPGTWTRQDVTVAFACADAGAVRSGIAADTLAGRTLSADGAKLAVTSNGACIDNAGNAADPATLGGIAIDKTGPQISILAPTSTTFLLNQAVSVDYRCADLLADGATPGSGVAACVGPVASGGALDTGSVGTKTFTVSARDALGNTSSRSVTYTVGYNVCVLYDQAKAHQAGSTVPIKLALCDAGGANVSSPGIAVHATGLTQVGGNASGVVEDAGNANPDDNFRYAGGAYLFNLKTTGLAAGTWQLSFTVAGDPGPHSVQFQVR